MATDLKDEARQLAREIMNWTKGTPCDDLAEEHLAIRLHGFVCQQLAATQQVFLQGQETLAADLSKAQAELLEAKQETERLRQAVKVIEINELMIPQDNPDHAHSYKVGWADALYAVRAALEQKK